MAHSLRRCIHLCEAESKNVEDEPPEDSTDDAVFLQQFFSASTRMRWHHPWGHVKGRVQI